MNKLWKATSSQSLKVSSRENARAGVLRVELGDHYSVFCTRVYVRKKTGRKCMRILVYILFNELYENITVYFFNELCLLFFPTSHLILCFPFVMAFKRVLLKSSYSKIYKESDNIIYCSNWHLKGKRGLY